jgi:hypothetical protein
MAHDPTPCGRDMIERLIVTTGLLALVAGAAPAQEAPRATRGCFRGGPAGECRWFMITESGLGYRVSEVVAGDERALFSFNLGAMVNRGDNSALGAYGFLNFEGEGRGGLGLRYRRWLSESAGLDLSAGVHLQGNASSGLVSAGSPTIQARVMVEDLVGVTARLDLLRVKGGCFSEPCAGRTDRTDTRIYVGVEGGSWLGTAGFAAGAAFIALLLAIFAGSS